MLISFWKDRPDSFNEIHGSSKEYLTFSHKAVRESRWFPLFLEKLMTLLKKKSIKSRKMEFLKTSEMHYFLLENCVQTFTSSSNRILRGINFQKEAVPKASMPAILNHLTVVKCKFIFYYLEPCRPVKTIYFSIHKNNIPNYKNNLIIRWDSSV